VKVTCDCNPEKSSLQPGGGEAGVNCENAVALAGPEKTPTTVSKLLPAVLTVTDPLDAAVNFSHVVAPMLAQAFVSPVCKFAPELL
jgi:hypothetical protein